MRAAPVVPMFYAPDMIVTSTDGKQRLLRVSRLFAGVEDELLTEFARRTWSRTLRAGERLWRAGDPAIHFTLIQSGLVKIVRHLPDGAEAIVALFGPRESLGETAVLERQPYPADAVVASESATVLRIDAAPVLAAMETHPSVTAAMNRALLDHTRALNDKITVMSAGSVDQRLATLFLLLNDRFGDEREDGTTVVPVRLSRQELSRLIGATVETVIRTMSRWKKAGIMETHTDGFLLYDTGRLQRIVRGEK